MADAEECQHCGKSLTSQSARKRGMTDLRSYEQKTVPSWAMYLIVGLALACLILMYVQGCEENNRPKGDVGHLRLMTPADEA